MTSLISPGVQFQVPPLETALSVNILQKIGSGRQVQVYALPENNLVIKIPKSDMEIEEPERRRQGLELMIARMNANTYLPTIHVSENASYPFVEFQERAQTLYFDCLQKIAQSKKERGFFSEIQALFAYEKRLWSRGLFLLDWAGQLNNFSADNGTLKLFDFGSITDKEEIAIEFLDKEIEGKIEEVVQSLRQRDFTIDCHETYRKIAHDTYNSDVLLNIWGSSL
ncbi:hypothetical protein HY483_00985 [Candidatus Woesearchaeota archaeon]|nr:hypothetical protein [Candidatus Woesearchaeota archaeon]